MKIIAIDECVSHRTGTLSRVTAQMITKALGFPSNIRDDPDKVVNSWGFEADGEPCGIWDYKGSHLMDSYSTFGPATVFDKLFPGKHGR